MRFDFAATGQQYGVLVEGLIMTAWLAASSFLLVLAVGCGLAIVQLAGYKTINRLLGAYVELMRNTPLLVTVYLMYFGLPLAGIMLSEFATLLLALVMQHSVFVAEILRGAFMSVSSGQVLAAKALGMSRMRIFTIVMIPQALSTAMPALTGALIILLQDTSLASAISVVDLTMAAKIISQRTATSFEPFIVIALIYLGLALVLGHVGRTLEHRFSVAR